MLTHSTASHAPSRHVTVSGGSERKDGVLIVTHRESVPQGDLAHYFRRNPDVAALPVICLR